jgi:hypothetical protein
MHRPGIASITGDKIYLDTTSMVEVERSRLRRHPKRGVTGQGHEAANRSCLLIEKSLSQNLTFRSTQALSGAPGVKNVALGTGELPAYGPVVYAGKGSAWKAPWALSDVFASCAAV